MLLCTCGVMYASDRSFRGDRPSACFRSGGAAIDPKTPPQGLPRSQSRQAEEEGKSQGRPGKSSSGPGSGTSSRISLVFVLGVCISRYFFSMNKAFVCTTLVHYIVSDGPVGNAKALRQSCRRMFLPNDSVTSTPWTGYGYLLNDLDFSGQTYSRSV